MTVETIKAGFTYPTIESQPGLPFYQTILATHKKLKENAASVQSNLGGGRHGLLGLALKNTLYTTVAVEPFTKPTSPGISPTIPTGATGPQISEIVRQHTQNLRIWCETTRTDQALQQQIITVFDKEYLLGLRDPHTGFVGITTLDMLQHPYDNYGVISAVDLADNDDKLREAYDPSQPLETLFHRFEAVVEYADAAKRPYVPDQLVSRDFLLILKTGLYNDAYKLWQIKLSY